MTTPSTTKTQKAPGKSFRRGITLMDAIEQFATKEQAETWFVEQRWPDGVVCPFCQSRNIQERPTRQPQPYRCRNCRKDFSVTVGTLLHRSHIPLHKWAVAFFLYSTNLKGVSSMKLHRDLGITQKSAWFMAHRIREAWNPVADRFAGPVEADETYIGGKETAKHASKKLKAGRGTVGKQAIAGLKDRASNQVKAKTVKTTSARNLQGFVHAETKSTATVYTDEAAAYKGMNRMHGSVKHSVGEYVDGAIHTNGMESFWAMLKRGYVGTYHHFSFKHADRYVLEFSGRHNQRPLDTIDQMEGMARGIEGKHLPYAELIAEE